jgi:tetratricopeptide (TPR) repeat protein
MSGHFEEAIAAAEDTITADPFDPSGWAIRAMALDWGGQPALAAASAQRAIELAGDENPQVAARARAFLAEAYFDLEQYDRALSTVNQALETDPNSYEAYRNRALIVQSTQFDFAAAQNDLEIAHDLAPNLPYITIDLALLLAREDTDASIAILNELVELNPQNTRVLFWLGSQYLNAVGDLPSATDYLSRCVDIDPDNISCHYVLGRAQMRSELYSAASDSFQTALELGSDDPRHYWWAGRALVLNVDGGCPVASPFFQRGYPLAQQSGDETLILDFEDQMRSCGLLGAPEATEEATEEPAADANA